MAERATKLATESDLPQLRFDTLMRAFSESADDLARFSHESTIGDFMTYLAEPTRRRTLRRRAHKFGYRIDQQQSRQGFEALQAVFSLLAETEASDDDGCPPYTNNARGWARTNG